MGVEEEARRPMDYFSHDSNAASDVKCRKLLRRCGMSGYGRWWRLCEILAATEGHAVSLECVEDAEMLADDLMFDSVEQLVDFLHTLCEIGFVSGMGDGVFTSERMMENAYKVGKMRAGGKAGGKLGGRPRKGDGKPLGLYQEQA